MWDGVVEVVFGGCFVDCVDDFVGMCIDVVELYVFGVFEGF